MGRIILFAGAMLIFGVVAVRLVERPGHDAPRAPSAMAATPVPSSNSRTVTLSRGKGGHFWTDARVDGRRLELVVDTGASTIALRASDAARLGIHPAARDYTVNVATANGVTRAALVQLRTVESAISSCATFRRSSRATTRSASICSAWRSSPSCAGPTSAASSSSSNSGPRFPTCDRRPCGGGGNSTWFGMLAFIRGLTGGKAAEFPVLHHRPAPRRLSRLLRPPRAQDSAYRLDRGAWHALYALLRGNTGLHAQSRDPDDRAHAVGARRAQQRLAIAAQIQHLRRRAACRRLRHRVGGQEPPAEFFRIPGGAQTPSAASGRPRA